MGVMASHTSLPFDNAVDKRQRVFLLYQVFLVAVTGDAECHRAFGPELITVFFAVRVMAEGTSAEDHRSMDECTGFPGFFPGMTRKADVLYLGGGKPDPPWPDGLLVAAKALLTDRGAVLPGVLTDDVRVAGDTGCLFLEAHIFNGCGLLQIMATLAALGQLVVPVKEEDLFAERIGIQIGLQLPISELHPLATGDDGKAVFPRLQRQPEVKEVILLMAFGHNRLKLYAGLFHPHLKGLPVPELTQNKMGFRIPGNDSGSRQGSQHFHIGCLCLGPEQRGLNTRKTEEQQKANGNPTAMQRVPAIIAIQNPGH
jgi:hypothetical protein